MKPQSLLSFEAYRASAYFTALDGLRALSILLVLLHHGPRVGVGCRVLAENGCYGVSGFFVISGFLICTLLLREQREQGRINLGRFYARRALRLLPLYYAVLAVQALLVLGLRQYSPENQALFVEKLPSYLFYFSNWLSTASQGPFFCAWSLAVEEQFYLGFGFLLVFAPRHWLPGLIGTALLLKFAVYQWLGSVDVDSTLWRIAFSYQEAILWGVLLAFALDRRAIYERLAAVLGMPWLVPCIGLLATAWLATHEMMSASTWDAELTYLLMTLVVAGVVMRSSVSVLCHPWLVHIGRISYGIYLLHMLVGSTVRKLPLDGLPILYYLLSTLGVIGLASVVYRIFELPIISYYKTRLGPQRSQADAFARSATHAAVAAPRESGGG